MFPVGQLIVDSLTHALIIAIPLALIGHPDLAVYGIMGAVLIDVDVAFNLFSKREARLYIFTHGGITHSFMGAFAIVLLSSAAAFALSPLFPSPVAPFGPLAVAAIAAGALTHITADYLAYPGIPLFYPFSDRKYTLGILGGPSAFLVLASLAYIGAMAIGIASIAQPWPYAAFFGLVIALSAGTKAAIALKVKGRTIATIDPRRWMVIEDLPDVYRFYSYDLFKGASPEEDYEKFKGLTLAEVAGYARMPELKRLRYNSYIVTAEKNGGTITFRDPIREKGHIWYPPDFKSLVISVE